MNMATSKRSFARRVGFLAAFILATNAIACFWDRDTLAQEARGLPHIVDVLLGRVDRWPSTVYGQRLSAVTAELDADATRLELYDDAAVAADRLGRRDEAVEWMQRKRAVLDELPAEAPQRAEHEYRYLANLGTILAHRWIAEGAIREAGDDLDQAIAHIRAAVALNPDAHFGREPVQLALLERIARGVASDGTNLSWFVDSLYPESDEPRVFVVTEVQTAGTIDDQAMIDGLVGLIVLGNAWESVDVYASLAEVLARRADSSLALLALARAEELAAAGRRSLIFGERTGEALAALRDQLELFFHPERAETYYARARLWAERENERRDEYINAMLTAGRHPDTDPVVMDSFKPTPRPALPSGFLGTDFDRGLGWALTVIGAGIVAVLIAVVSAVSWWCRRFVARRKALSLIDHQG
jgi:tetratricopeptide (TPR) repeat protein